LPKPPPTGPGEPTTKPFFPGLDKFLGDAGGLALAALLILGLASASRN
jgi:hypothetical protein